MTEALKPDQMPDEIVARCPICKRGYVWVPSNGGTCLRCRIRLEPIVVLPTPSEATI